MDRVASLQKRAAELTRKLFISQPTIIRVATVLEIVAGTDPLLKALGRSLGAVFLQKGVTDLPSIHGKPAAEWFEAQPRKDTNALIQRLPPDYLDEFALKIRQRITGKFNESLAREAISGWIMRFVLLKGWNNMDEGMSLDRARNYVLTGVQREALNLIKKDRRHQYDRSIHEEDDEGKRRVDPSDPNAMKDFLEEMPMWKAPRVRHILEQKVHPDAPLFLDLLFEGHAMKDIVGDKATGRESMLPHVKERPMAYYNWLKTYNPKIVEILSEIGKQEQGAAA